MLRVFTYKIEKSESVLFFLKEKGYSANCLTLLKHTVGAVKLNNESVFLNRQMTVGDELTIILDEKEISKNVVPVNIPIDIVYEDEDILVVNKPPDMPIHPSQNNHDNSLGNALAYYYAQQGKAFVYRCINRLDRNTSGLTLIAKNMVSAGILSGDIANKKKGNIQREYLAIVKGHLPSESGTIDAPIARKEGSTIERMVDFEKGEMAITNYKVVHEKNEHTLVSLILETGRTHQIRVHMKYIDCPLIGDYIYNPDMENINRQALHSYRLSFKHPITDEEMIFTAPLPEDMKWME